MGINVLSLFDGMSCGQIALDRSGIDVDNYYASEVDKWAIQVAQANYPNTIQLGDITQLDTSNLPKIDLVMGGSPCQGFSFAGKQLAFDDPRSKLFFEFVRVLKEVKPRYFLLENVKMKKEFQDEISRLLGCEPILINSALVSAQNRNRLYWTNIPNIKQPEDKCISMKDILGGVNLYNRSTLINDSSYYSTRDKSYCIDANYAKGTNFRRYFFCGSRQLVLEEGNLPEDMEKETANKIMKEDGNRWRMLLPIECERLQTVPDGYTGCVSNSQRYKMLGNGWTVDVAAHIFKNIKEEYK